ncbi:hypothetical protein CRM77_05190 [Micrococcus luteus]|nr:hypothetical protein CRM77_05190 [Micrococcus luteus]
MAASTSETTRPTTGRYTTMRDSTVQTTPPLGGAHVKNAHLPAVDDRYPGGIQAVGGIVILSAGDKCRVEAAHLQQDLTPGGEVAAHERRTDQPAHGRAWGNRQGPLYQQTTPLLQAQP